eukprot:7439722-Alexandrium_andersonii.AAC.1
MMRRRLAEAERSNSTLLSAAGTWQGWKKAEVLAGPTVGNPAARRSGREGSAIPTRAPACLLYTSDAADDM